MSSPTPLPKISGDNAPGDLVVESLLRLAGAREPLPADRMQRLKVAGHAEWRKLVTKRRRQQLTRRSVSGLAAAAMIALAMKAWTGVGPVVPAPAEFAVVESLAGSPRLITDAGQQGGGLLRVGDRLLVGPHQISLGGGTATLRLTGGQTMWVDRDSLLRLAAAGVVVLDRGAVDIESGGAGSLEVRTPVGAVRDVGTKFEVRLTPSGLRVRVRDGAVIVERDQQQHEAHAGDELVLGASGTLTRRTVTGDGSEWAWATDALATFELEGRSLGEFLEWIAHENGWRLQFASAAVQDKARTTTLHGSIQGLPPRQAIAAVMPASGVEFRLTAGVLSIRLAARGRD